MHSSTQKPNGTLLNEELGSVVRVQDGGMMAMYRSELQLIACVPRDCRSIIAAYIARPKMSTAGTCGGFCPAELSGVMVCPHNNKTAERRRTRYADRRRLTARRELFTEL